MYEKIIMWHIRFPPKAHVTIYSISISIYIYVMYIHTKNERQQCESERNDKKCVNDI